MNEDFVNNMAYEKEVTLLFCSERAEEVKRELSEISQIRGYLVSPASSEIIEDTYLDTATRLLAVEHWALRIRRDNAGHRITLKGPSRLTEWRGLVRVELEEPWSRAALQDALIKLEQFHMHLGMLVGSFNPANPIETMKSLGFDIIQSRRLQRRRRSLAEYEAGPEIAELVIDDVIYRFGSQEILHSELEIEAKTEDASRVVRDIAEELIDRYELELRIWPHGKLATGQAIEQLLFAGKLTDLMNGNRLEPEAYEVVAECLQSTALKEQKAP